jgi:hypothetical protein
MSVVFKITKDCLEPNSKIVNSYHFDINDKKEDDAANIKAFDAAPHVRIRLLDDDRIVYYYGLIPAASLEIEDGGEELLRPLNWAEYYAGCTIIQHYIDGKWQMVVD